MTDIQFKSPLSSWLTWKIVLLFMVVFVIAFMPKASEDISYTVIALLILLLFAPYSFFVAQVMLTDEGVKYRRFLRWTHKLWSEVKAVESPSFYPRDVIVLKPDTRT